MNILRAVLKTTLVLPYSHIKEEYYYFLGKDCKFSAITLFVDSYFYAEATGRKSGDVAVMHSPLIFTKRPMCMYLYSSTHGDGRLTGALISLTNAGKKVKIERNLTADTYSGKWRFNSMQLPTNHIFKVRRLPFP